MNIKGISLGSNFKYLRNYAGKNQTEFGKLFGCTRGMIDTYERDIAKPSLELINKIAKHYSIPVEVLTTKDLKLNPGLLYVGASVEQQKGVVHNDLLEAKDEQIKILKDEIKFLRSQLENYIKNKG